MTDPRPRPKYGEYSDVPPVPVPVPDPVISEPAVVAPPLAPRRTWDVVLTTMLLLFGVWDVATSFGRFSNLAPFIRDAYEAQGIGIFTSDSLATSMGLVINIGRVILLVVAIIVSLRLISRHRLSFWAPLGAGVAAGLLVVVCLAIVVLGDPALAAYANSQAQ